MENKQTPERWEERAKRLEFQLRRLIYGYRVSGVDALKSEEWKILYDIAEAILVEGNPIASAPSLQSEIDRLKEERQELVKIIQDCKPAVLHCYEQSSRNGAHQEFLSEDRDLMRRMEEATRIK